MEARRIEITIMFRFRILRVPSKNISNVKSPTLKAKLVRKKSSRER